MTKVIDLQRNDCKVNAAEQWGKEPEKRAAREHRCESVSLSAGEAGFRRTWPARGFHLNTQRATRKGSKFLDLSLSPNLHKASNKTFLRSEISVD
jgi:hypothetical protein